MSPRAEIAIPSLSDWYSRAAATATYDTLARLPAVLYFGVILSLQAGGFARDLVAWQAGAEALAVSSVLARAAILALMLTMAALTIFRHRPVARAGGLLPRLTALLASVCFFGFVFLPRAEPSAAFDTASFLLILAGNILTLAVVTRLGRSFSTMAEARRLVVSGPYRFVRHPLYAAEQVAVVGMFLQYRSAGAAVLVVVQLALQIVRMANEERVLEDAFPEYAEYRRRTARIIPGIY